MLWEKFSLWKNSVKWLIFVLIVTMQLFYIKFILFDQLIVLYYSFL